MSEIKKGDTWVNKLDETNTVTLATVSDFRVTGSSTKDGSYMASRHDFLHYFKPSEQGCKDDTPMRLIGIAGQARAGKDTLASYMLDNLDGTWSRSSFADPLKEMLRAIGVDCSDDVKAVVSDDYGVTPRHMMQTLGTEWGRHTIDNDIWVKAFARLNAGKCVIVPDVRFENEAELVREHGVLIHLVGRGGIEGKHVSENAIEFNPGDIVIDNSRDLAWLHGQVDGNAVLDEFVSAE